MNKFHWGHALLLFFIIYIAILLGTVLKTTTIDRELVQDDYYALDINYQERYDRIENRKYLERDMTVRYVIKEECVFFDFGASMPKITGTVRMYRVAGKKAEDIIYDFDIPEGNTFCLDVGKIIAGKWVTEVNWSDQKSSYYKEDRIIISRS